LFREVKASQISIQTTEHVNRSRHGGVRDALPEQRCDRGVGLEVENLQQKLLDLVTCGLPGERRHGVRTSGMTSQFIGTYQ
jgi:hypothetical protein